MHMIVKRLAFIFCISFMLFSAAWAADSPTQDPIYPDRRKPQFTKNFGYALFPYPYSLPGIGSGIGLVGGAMNIADTYTDAYGIVFTGDVRGEAVGVADIHLIPRRLILDVGYSALNKATIQSYSQRGMNTDKNDYRLLELGDTEYYGGRMTATFFDRRFEIYSAWYQGASKLKSIRDRDGNVIVEAQNAPRQTGHVTSFGSRLDLTDDYSDPRRGFRIDVTRSQSPPSDSGPDYYVMDYNTTAYIPIGRRSTWAFNFLRSDAVVLKTGATTTAELHLGLNCSTITDPQQQQFCNEVIQNMIANNKYGTATSLGGFSRLRGYPQGRYKGAHTLFYGTEIRWNLTDERTPFNIFVMKDVRTSVQVALFYETGVTSDVESDLTRRSNMRDDYGLGVRVVTASGVVFRGDLGFGREGASPAIFIGYPWEI
ncbi:MAG: BamA/TamA family outer membrane protein [Nitrospiraceae bacterium]|nr:BamA/TamA family outer membrane protein [Nitrospiraceae bacterium]